MYQRDVNEIKGFVRWRGPDALVNNGLFVLLTIQAGLSTVRGSMVKVERDGYDADCLWGKKSEGYQYLVGRPAAPAQRGISLGPTSGHGWAA